MMYLIINTLLNIIIFIGALLLGIYLNKKTNIQTKTTKLINKITKKDKAIIISPSKILKHKQFNDSLKEKNNF